jgi:hypothetical protein
MDPSVSLRVGVSPWSDFGTLAGYWPDAVRMRAARGRISATGRGPGSRRARGGILLRRQWTRNWVVCAALEAGAVSLRAVKFVTLDGVALSGLNTNIGRIVFGAVFTFLAADEATGPALDAIDHGRPQRRGRVHQAA